MNFRYIKTTVTALMLVLLPAVALAHGISEADKAVMLDGFDFLITEPPPAAAEWQAVHDRLSRAAAQS